MKGFGDSIKAVLHNFLSSLPLPEGGLDIVTFRTILLPFSDVGKSVTEVARILRQRGQVEVIGFFFSPQVLEE